MRLSLDRRLTPYVFAAPAVLIMLFGLLYPVVEALRLAFYEVRLGEQITPQAFAGWRFLPRRCRIRPFGSRWP